MKRIVIIFFAILMIPFLAHADEPEKIATKGYVDGGLTHLLGQIDTAIGNYIPASEKGANNGVATLTGTTLTSSQIPTDVAMTTGATFTGTVSLPAIDGESNVTAVTKGYVDNATTANKIEDITYNSTYSFDDTTTNSTYAYSKNGFVSISFDIKNSSEIPDTIVTSPGGVPIGNIPDGYRPSASISSVVIIYAEDCGPVVSHMTIHESGAITVNEGTGALLNQLIAPGSRFFAQFNYPASP